MKKIISFLLAFSMILSFIPTAVFADSLGNEVSVEQSNPFTDVKEDDWFYDAVQYARINGFFNGTSETTFDPNGTMTRGMFVTVLGRMAGVDPENYSGDTAFTDVPSNAYYAPYVEWASKYGITSGTGENQFSPDALITRQQMAVFFVRYFDAFDVEYDTGIEVDTVPADYDKIADYAETAVLKLWSKGLLNGDGVNFNPDSNATRAENATVCMRTDRVVDVWYKEPGVPSDRVRIEYPLVDDESDGDGTTDDDGTADDGDTTDESGTTNPDRPSGNYPIIIPQSKTCKVTFVTNGADPIESKTIDKGTLVSELPTPYRENYIFTGWYYDKGMSKLASKSDAITSNTTLYAGYIQTEALEPVESPTFAAAMDVDGDFSVTVISTDPTLSAEQVQSAIEVEVAADSSQTDLFVVSGSNGSYVISGNGGFDAGKNFRITLHDTRLSFEGELDTVREFNFATKKEQVLNLTISNDMLFIPMEDVSDIINDGVSVDSLSIALYEADEDGNVSPADLTTGSFTYNGTLELKVGDVAAIYAGLRPDLRTLDSTAEENGDLAYVEIIAVEGNRISYKNADAEQVIFTPDVLPIPVEHDQDTAPDTITLENKHLDFSADVYAYMELDSQTTVDIGDYMLFYTGVIGQSETAQGYALIEDVEIGADVTVITYVTVTWEEVEQAMDIYVQDQVQGSELLEGVDTDELESAIEQHAVESGFAEEAALYLASLALATDSFTEWKDDVNINDVRFTLDDGTPLSPEEIRLMADGNKVSVETEKLKASISTSLKHFSGYSGLRLTLDVGIKITIQPSANSDATLEITVTGSFEQEMRLSIGASSEAIWKVWGIFPYIAEYRVTANVDLFDYTGIEIDAQMITKEKEEEEEEDDKDDKKSGTSSKIDQITEKIEKGIDIASQIKEILNAKDEEEGDGDDEGAETINNALQQKYKEMLESEAEWVNIIEKELVSKELRVPPALPIIAIKFEANFVVQVKASVSVGFEFEYMNGKRYLYHINVFAGTVSNDVIDIQEETYEFTFYAMGHLGIKAGVAVEFAIGLLSTKVASVGFEAEAGVYAKLWGYFYYELKYTASAGRAQSYSGALMIEVGAYLEVDFKASALGGLASKEITLVDKEWPFWSIGKEDCVQDFVTPKAETPEVKLKQYIRSTVLSNDLFKMEYLDMKGGDMKSAVYSDETRFVISIDNPAFNYDPTTNTLSVTPPEGSVKEEGTMTITWIAYPLAFTSKPIQREIPLYWDNLRDGYVIVPYTNGGSYISIINQRYDSEVKVPADPVKDGYDFAGWYADSEFTTPYEWPVKMPNADANVYAMWTPSTDTPYVVEHYQQIIGTPDYNLVYTEYMTGTTNDIVTPATETYEGYITPMAEAIEILPDGSTIQRYYYDLQTHTVTFDPGIVGGDVISYELDFGGRVTEPQFAANGYIFLGWDREIDPYMGEEDVVYTAQWMEDPATSYRVEYYVQQSDGRYVMQDFAAYSGTTGYVITEEMLRNGATLADGNGELVNADELYEIENGVSFKNITVGGEDLTAKGEDPTVLPNGKTIIKVNYQRHSYKLTFDLANGEESLVYDVYYGASVSLPENIRRQGYTLVEWSPAFSDSMAGKDTTYTAKWQANDYTVSFDANGGTGEMEVQPMVYDVTSTLYANTFLRTGYDFAGWSVIRNGSVRYADKESAANLGTEKDQNVVLYASWKPTVYTITYNDSLAHSNPLTYTIESGAINLMNPEDKEGYTFTGWFENDDFSGEAVVMIAAGSYGDIELYAGYVPNPYEIRFNANGGEGEMESLAMVYDLKKVLPTNEFVRTGYTFMGWARSAEGSVAFSDAERVVNLESAPGKVINLYAVWKLDTYSVEYVMNGGVNASGNPGTYTVLDTVVLSEPTRTGYKFMGWFTEATGDTAVTDIPAGSTGNMTLYAVWKANTNTPYVVEHYLQDLHESTYTLEKREIFTGTTDTAITPAVMDYEGFRAPTVQTCTIAPDGSLVVQYMYTRLSFALTLHYEDGVTPSETIADEYGAPITLPIPQREGYGFTGWYLENGTSVTANTMPAITATLYAHWKAGEYGYTVYHYQEALDGSYKLADTVTGTATMDSSLTPELKEYEGFTAPDADTITITNSSDENVVEYRYKRNQYTLTWDLDGGSADAGYTAGTVSYGATIVAPTAVKPGYTGTWATEPLQTMPAEDLTYVMNWTANNYTVTFDMGNGVALESRTVTFDDAYGTLPAPEKAGYEFTGWYTSAAHGDEITASSTVKTADDHTLYAHWELIVYSISYELDGGINSSLNPTDYNVEKVIAIKEPTKEGHTFLGWTFAGQDEPVRDVILDGATGDRSYTANWQINTYKVTFYRENGMLIEELRLDYGSAITVPDAGTRDGYTFGGWGAEVPATMPAQNLNFITQWKLNTYSITYKLNGGENHPDNVTYYTSESPDIEFAPATRDGYTFGGWYTDEALTEPITAIAGGSTGAVTLYAKWTANTYTVKMHLNNNTADVITQTFTYDVRTALTKHNATYTGYSFVGWATEANGDAIYTNGAKLSNLTIEANGTVHLYGIWEPVVYTVSYQNLFEVPNNPLNPTEFTVLDRTLVFEALTTDRVGYNFAGWYADEMLTVPITGSYTVNEAHNINIYAKWDANPYSVTFNNNLRDGSALGESTQLMVYGSNTNLKPFEEMGFSYRGHTFLGWHTEQDAQAPLYTDGQLVSSLTPSGNITLYAVWGVNEYTITYNIGTGATVHNNPASYNVWSDDITLEAPTDIKEGYQFLGWFDDLGNQITTIVKSSIGDRSYTARWAHGGIFTLSSTVTTAADTTGVKVTYTIERTLPAGTEATTDTQYVYYRTVNGTAYGGTAARIHFIHVGGEDVYATFDKSTFSKTFTVHQIGYWVGDKDIATYTDGIDRYFDTEIYKVVNTVHTAYTGEMGSNTSCRYTIKQGDTYKMNTVYGDWVGNKIFSSSITVKNNGFEFSGATTVAGKIGLASSYTLAQKLYLGLVGAQLGFYTNMDLQENEECFQEINLWYGGKVIGYWKYDGEGDNLMSYWFAKLHLPAKKAQGNLKLNTYTIDSNYYKSINNNNGFFVVPMPSSTTEIGLQYATSGASPNRWTAGSVTAYTKPYDGAEPTQTGLARMAFGQYKPGDKITITVLFNEIVKSASNVSVGTISGLPANNWTYVSGYGTNALTFTGTVTGNIDITPELNDKLAAIKPLSGTFSDMY